MAKTTPASAVTQALALFFEQYQVDRSPSNNT